VAVIGIELPGGLLDDIAAGICHIERIGVHIAQELPNSYVYIWRNLEVVLDVREADVRREPRRCYKWTADTGGQSPGWLVGGLHIAVSIQHQNGGVVEPRCADAASRAHD